MGIDPKIFVNCQNKRNFQEIESTTVQTIGTMNINVLIKDTEFPITFDVFHNNFPLPEASIIRLTFLKKKNKAVLVLIKDV